MSVVRLLRRNDPDTTAINIALSYETSDADLAQALERNLFIREIELSLYTERADWNSLLGVIATRANLETVKLTGNAPEELVRAFLQAIQQNTAIQRAKFIGIRLPTDISIFVDTASSLTSFGLYHGCDMEASEPEEGARRLAAALQRNKNIQSLQIFHLDDIFTIPILEGLRLNTSVKTFIFYPTFAPNVSDASSHALNQLLISTTSIQRFELTFNTRFSVGLLPSNAQAIVNSGSVSELKFLDCEFNSENTAQFRSILHNKRNLTTLCLHGCNFVGEVYEDIVSLVSRPDSLLRCFEFQRMYYFQAALTDVQFTNLLRVIQKSKLERFRIGTGESQQQVLALTECIPSMKLKELEIVSRLTFEGLLKQDLLHAVENNFSLLSVKVEIGGQGSDLFDSAEDKQTLAFYANRNTCLDQWVDNPGIVEQSKVWPEAMSLAERAGPSALFRGLRWVLESDYVKLPASRRKRKRPRYYVPS